MRRWVAGMLSACLLVIAAGPALGQEPSEPPPWWESPPMWSGGRVEVSGLGVAVSFPDDWRVWSLERQTEPVWPVWLWAEELGPDVEMYNVLYATGPDTSAGDREDECLLLLYRPTDVTGEEFGWAIHDFYGEHITVDATPEGLARVRVGDNPFPPVELYAIADGDTLATLQCVGIEKDYDRWLSYAETIEFLPVEE